MEVNSVEKSKIRKHYFNLRKSLTKKDALEKSEQICQNFIQNLLPNIHNSKDNLFSLYFDAYNEVATNSISKYFTQNNISFSYPKIIGKNSALKFIKYSNTAKIISSELYKDVFEIDSNDFVEPNILIIPLVSFDSHKMRLGMGGGFFDKTIDQLKSNNKNLLIVALAYDFQLFNDRLPRENHDKKVDYIVNETQIFS